MATGHSILDTLNQTSKGGQPSGPSGKFRTKDIPITELYRNEGNFYAVTEVKELADAILMSGLLENLAVVYDPCDAGQYRIISGERRWEALKSLVETGHDEFAVVTCNVRAKRSHEEEMIELIHANSQRVKSVEDQMQEYSTLKRTLEAMRADGQTLEGFRLDTGRLRDVIAEILGKSKTKIAQIERINTHLIPELRGLLENGSLKFSAAYSLAGMDEQDQEDAYARAKEEEREITHAELKRTKPENDTNVWASHSCEMVHGKCEHYHVIKANFFRGGELEGCAGCCEICRSRENCDFCCEIVAAKNDMRKTEIEAAPKTIVSLCYSCENFQNCLDRTDKTTKCGKYRDKREAKEQEPVQPVETYIEDKEAEKERAKRTIARSTERQEDLMEMIRHCIACAGLPETQMTACLVLHEKMRKKMDERMVNADVLENRFGCVDEDGIVKDCSECDEYYTPGEIMDIIEEAVMVTDF